MTDIRNIVNNDANSDAVDGLRLDCDEFICLWIA